MVSFYIYYNIYIHRHIHTYIYIYKYKKIAVNPKRYTGIRNISYRWPNQYNLQYGINILAENTLDDQSTINGYLWEDP